MIIGLSGYLKSGKDTAGQMILDLTMQKNHETMEDEFGDPLMDTKGNYVTYPDIPSFKIKKFAEALKQVASLMTGIPRERFEDQEFKEGKMPPEWNHWIVQWKHGDDGPGRMSFKTKEMAEAWINDVFEEPEEVLDNDSMFYFEEMTVRQFLQKLGTDGVRNQVHRDAWVISAMAGYNEGKHWVFTDCRFPNEARAIKDRGGIIIRLNRYPPGCSPELMDRTESETSLDDWEFDHVIYNIGTLDDLKAQMKEILKKFVHDSKDRVVRKQSFEQAALIRDIERTLH